MIRSLLMTLALLTLALLTGAAQAQAQAKDRAQEGMVLFKTRGFVMGDRFNVPLYLFCLTPPQAETILGAAERYVVFQQSYDVEHALRLIGNSGREAHFATNRACYESILLTYRQHGLDPESLEFLGRICPPPMGRDKPVACP